MLRIPTLATAILAVSTLIALPSWKATAEPLPFAKEIAAFETRRQESPPADGSILCIGSSSMRMWADRMDADLAPLSLVKLGFGGSKFKDAIAHFDSLVAPYNPRAILLYEGDNDINSGMTPFEVARDFLTFATKVHEQDPAIRIYVISIKPSTKRAGVLADSLKANSIIETLCLQDPRFVFVDVMTPLLGPQGELIADYYVEDGVHLNQAGYDVWARAIRNVIVPLERAHEKE
ncbi:hypothetical protein IEN85_17570 [Pelagicoccus sp. NFK12]|uniref:SGNH hydrolase-type esterase domain-containing protein n=1 Tax=Pelagicoccus enzymogenes TaxID=2773457 RepID=A0A927FAH8_9BACT|nr:GDSL-type esterase/lipase family protein [Pelagicoccus enzymogenes]MBD5781314.1 hypothetical protein [Pelagicoccus enzymogenes]